MGTPATKKPSNAARLKRKIDTITNKISKSPTKKTDTDTEQLITIFPASSSTPIEERNIHTPPTTHTNPNNTPEERLKKDEVTETTHMEEGLHDDVSVLSSISSLNTNSIGIKF